MKIMVYFPIIGSKAGVAFYTENVINNFLKYTNNRLVLVTNEEGKRLFNLRESKNLEVIVYNVKSSMKNIYFQMFTLNRLIDKYNITHMFFTSNPVILKKSKGVKYFSTIHDLNEFEIENKYGYIKNFYRKNVMLPLAVKKNDHIITSSNFSLNQFKKHYPQYINKVKLVYLGIKEFKYYKEIKKEKIILFVGRVDPIGKNLYEMLDAVKRIVSYDDEYKLFIIGGKFIGSEEFLKRCEDELGKNFKYLGFVSDEELERYINKSRYTILFSKYEGFGLPAVESIACGTPVIINENCKALCEILGECRIYINTLDIKQFIEIESDDEKYKLLVSNGLNLSKYYTWKGCVLELNNLFKLEM